jgi:flagellar basal-body rod modification protein FlgD
MNTASFNSQIGRDQFMELLVTQLRNQDPLEPVNQQDFLGQLAQFSSLEGIERLNLNFAESLKFQQLSQGGALVGSRVEYTNPQGELRTGRVDSARVLNGELRFQIGDDTVGLGDLTGVVRDV